MTTDKGEAMSNNDENTLADMLRDKGINEAADHANSEIEQWCNTAFNALLLFLDKNPVEFLGEDIRMWATNVPEPPSKRAWGQVILKAARLKLIKKIGYARTTNPLAHRTPATLWAKTK